MRLTGDATACDTSREYHFVATKPLCLRSERGTVIASMITTAAALPMHSDTNLEFLCFDPASTDLPTVFQGTGSDHQKERKVYSPSAVYSIYNVGLSDKAYAYLTGHS